MDDLKRVLDRGVAGFEPSFDAFERTREIVDRRSRGQRVLAGVLAFALVAGVAIGLWSAFRPRTVPIGSVTSRQPTVTATFRVLGGVTDVAYGFGSLWVPGPETLRRMDPLTGRVIATVDVPGNSDYRMVAIGEDAVWMTDSGGPSVLRIDPATNTLVATISITGAPVDVVAIGRWVWVATADPFSLFRIDELVGRAVQLAPSSSRFEPNGAFPPGNGVIEGGDGLVWIEGLEGHGLRGLDPGGGGPAHTIAFPYPQGIGAFGFGFGSVWVSHHPYVSRFDLATNHLIADIPVAGPGSIVTDAAGVWVVTARTSTEPASVVFIDPATNRVIGVPAQVGMTAVAITSGGGAVWVANFADSTIDRVELRAVTARSPGRP
jgi:DNA-binding beta-propeller fold protein YncE